MPGGANWSCRPTNMMKHSPSAHLRFRRHQKLPPRKPTKSSRLTNQRPKTNSLANYTPLARPTKVKSSTVLLHGNKVPPRQTQSPMESLTSDRRRSHSQNRNNSNLTRNVCKGVLYAPQGQRPDQTFHDPRSGPEFVADRGCWKIPSKN